MLRRENILAPTHGSVNRDLENMRVLSILVVVLMPTITLIANASTRKATLTTALSPSSTPVAHPVIDPAKELIRIARVHALREGGLALNVRHAATGEVRDICSRRSLSDVGEGQTRKVGAALRELKIPVGLALTSQPCRAGVTALLLGVDPVEVTNDLNPVLGGSDNSAARLKRMTARPLTGTNTPIVSHQHGAAEKWMQFTSISPRSWPFDRTAWERQAVGSADRAPSTQRLNPSNSVRQCVKFPSFDLVERIDLV